MAADFESLSNTTYASRTNTTCTAPSGIVNGDLLLMFVVTAADPEAPDPTPPDGFTAVPSLGIPDLGDGFNLELRSYYKIASGESGDYTVTHTACSSQVTMVRVSAVDTTTPFDVTPTLNDNNGSTTTWTGLTTVTDGALIVAVDVDFADNTTDFGPPSGSTPTFTERLDTTLTYVATGNLATAGATGDKTHTNNGGGGAPWGSVLLAIRPGEVITDPPVNTVAPAVTGTAQVGQTLSCTTGTWDNSPSGYTYQWQRRA